MRPSSWLTRGTADLPGNPGPRCGPIQSGRKKTGAIEIQLKKNGGFNKNLKIKFELGIYLKEYILNRTIGNR